MEVLAPRMHYEILAKYIDSFAQKGVVLQPLEANTPMSEGHKLVLVEPLRSYSGHLLLTFGVWKHYLLHKAPGVSLVVVGIEKKDPLFPNYVDLLSGIDQFVQKLHGAVPISQNQHIPATFGTDLVPKWQRFVVGHGNESIVQPMNEVTASLSWIHAELMAAEEEEYERVIKLFQSRTAVFQPTLDFWEELLNRWEKIQPFLPYFPFQTELIELKININALKPYFDSNLSDGAYFLQEKCYEKYRQLSNIIKTINNTYVPRPAQDIIG